MEGVINIHGKQYKTVALRVSEFRQTHGRLLSIVTEIVANGEYVVIKASIIDDEGRIIATGHAEEKRGSTNINKTSALENCETSAIGRALACFGLAGSEFASADEVVNALANQSKPAPKEPNYKALLWAHVGKNLDVFNELAQNAFGYDAKDMSAEDMKQLWEAIQ